MKFEIVTTSIVLLCLTALLAIAFSDVFSTSKYPHFEEITLIIMVVLVIIFISSLVIDSRKDG